MADVILTRGGLKSQIPEATIRKVTKVVPEGNRTSGGGGGNRNQELPKSTIQTPEPTPEPKPVQQQVEEERSERLVNSLRIREQIARDLQRENRSISSRELGRELKRRGTSITELREATRSAKEQVRRGGQNVFSLIEEEVKLGNPLEVKEKKKPENLYIDAKEIDFSQSKIISPESRVVNTDFYGQGSGQLEPITRQEEKKRKEARLKGSLTDVPKSGEVTQFGFGLGDDKVMIKSSAVDTRSTPELFFSSVSERIKQFTAIPEQTKELQKNIGRYFSEQKGTATVREPVFGTSQYEVTPEGIKQITYNEKEVTTRSAKEEVERAIGTFGKTSEITRDVGFDVATFYPRFAGGMTEYIFKDKSLSGAGRFAVERPIETLGVFAGGILELLPVAFKPILSKVDDFSKDLLKAEESVAKTEKEILRIRQKRAEQLRGDVGFIAEEGILTNKPIDKTLNIISNEISVSKDVARKEIGTRFFDDLEVLSKGEGKTVTEFSLGKGTIKQGLSEEVTLIKGQLGDIAETVKLPKFNYLPEIRSEAKFAFISKGITDDLGKKAVSYIAPITKTGRLSKTGEFQILTKVDDKISEITTLIPKRKTSSFKLEGSNRIITEQSGFIKRPTKIITEEAKTVSKIEDNLLVSSSLSKTVEEKGRGVFVEKSKFAELLLAPPKTVDELAKNTRLLSKEVDLSKTIIKEPEVSLGLELQGGKTKLIIDEVKRLKTKTESRQFGEMGLNIQPITLPRPISRKTDFARFGVEETNTNQLLKLEQEIFKPRVQPPKNLRLINPKQDTPSYVEMGLTGVVKEPSSSSIIISSTTQLNNQEIPSVQKFTGVIRPTEGFLDKEISIDTTTPALINFRNPQIDTIRGGNLLDEKLVSGTVVGVPKPTQRIDTGVIQEIKTETLPRTDSITKQKPREESLVDTQLLSRARSSTSLIRPQLPKTRVPLALPKLNLGKVPKTKTKESLFSIFTRTKGSDIKIGTAKTPSLAFSKLFKKLGGTLRASGFVTDEEGKRITPKTLPLGFRKGKKESSRVVEIKSRRLRRGTTGKEIQYFRSKKPKGGGVFRI